MRHTVHLELPHFRALIRALADTAEIDVEDALTAIHEQAAHLTDNEYGALAVIRDGYRQACDTERVAVTDGWSPTPARPRA